MKVHDPVSQLLYTEFYLLKHPPNRVCRKKGREEGDTEREKEGERERRDSCWWRRRREKMNRNQKILER